MSSTLHLNVSTTHSHQNEMILKCNKKQRVNGYSSSNKMNHYNHQPPPSSVARRNERERNRVKMVNMGFATLRQHVPNGSKNKKMSKVETLRSAVEYIRELQKLLGQTTTSNNENQCYNSNNNFEQYTIQASNSLATTTATSPGDVENCYATVLPSPSTIESNLLDQHHHHQHHSSLSNAPYLTGYNVTNNNSPTKPSLTYLNPHNSSPSPSLTSSDLTGSSSSPYTTENNVIIITNRSSANINQTTSNNIDEHQEDELFDFANWF